jgi:hypothetical protein
MAKMTGPSLLLFIHGTGVEPSPLLLRPLIGLLYQPWMMDGEDCGAMGGMIGRGSRRARRKTASVSLGNSHDLT